VGKPKPAAAPGSGADAADEARRAEGGCDGGAPPNAGDGDVSAGDEAGDEREPWTVEEETGEVPCRLRRAQWLERRRRRRRATPA